MHTHTRTRKRSVCMCASVTYATKKWINQKYYDDTCEYGDNNLANTNTSTINKWRQLLNNNKADINASTK